MAVNAADSSLVLPLGPDAGATGVDRTPASTRGGRSLLLGLIGAGIQASRSPALHEAEAAEQGLRCIYKLIDLAALHLTADDLDELLLAAERLGFAGLNITYPCKQAVLSKLDRLSPEADAIGAVNTVVFGDGRRIGHNTDCHGFAENFRRGMGDAPRRMVAQLGAGGAGAAVAVAALSLGAGALMIVDTDGARSAALAETLNRRFGPGRAMASDDLERVLTLADGIINTTPIGMPSHPGSPVPERLLRPSHWVADIVYVPLETELLRSARRLGCRTLAGGGMAVFQAAAAFELFTGLAPDTERMLRHFARL
ncbi:MAG: shikimate dehydrogenase [Proteobacteria bacterium]|nr:shikimate dehydrogenase [Pseudomonadota bacterium]MBI3498251.1 shikimate dehydrogenase [Pseudomonadota bacterium]